MFIRKLLMKEELLESHIKNIENNASKLKSDGQVPPKNITLEI